MNALPGIGVLHVLLSETMMTAERAETRDPSTPKRVFDQTPFRKVVPPHWLE